MLKLDEDIRSLSDFKRNTSELLDQMRRNHRPLVLTVNGKAEIVVQDAESYQQLLDELDKQETIAGIRKGLADMEAGRVRPAREALLAIKGRRALQRSSH